METSAAGATGCSFAAHASKQYSELAYSKQRSNLA
ncbi:hypothetical protein THITH_09130 [Thioalkalivibrio paradoxus ARh 1]|uniref:Uncharacterized protein n=1 Tax=Thioalkalivibrio paradoxus ARh 1 TaxID=713585 RepID=W0DSX9_9GAMM|nr:hypothetical protein THITH_09130 [Thioalkalivibrio paradoxus ARh 1]